MRDQACNASGHAHTGVTLRNGLFCWNGYDCRGIAFPDQYVKVCKLMHADVSVTLLLATKSGLCSDTLNLATEISCVLFPVVGKRAVFNHFQPNCMPEILPDTRRCTVLCARFYSGAGQLRVVSPLIYFMTTWVCGS